jgi:hypothetical protein
MRRRSFCNQASVHPCGVEPSGNASRCRSFWGKRLDEARGKKKDPASPWALKSTSVCKMRPSRGEGREQVITKVRGGRKTNNFHVGLDFFSGVFCCVASHQSSQAAHQRGSAADCGEYRQPKLLEWCLTRLDGAVPDTPWYIGLGPHDAPAPVEVAKHC